MKIFKDIWLRLRKTSGLPGNTVLVPMEEQKVPEVTEIKKVRKPRKKKETTNVTNASKTE